MEYKKGKTCNSVKHKRKREMAASMTNLTTNYSSRGNLKLKVYPISSKSSAWWKKYSELIKRKNDSDYRLKVHKEEMVKYIENKKLVSQSLNKWLLANPGNQDLPFISRLRSCIQDLKQLVSTETATAENKPHSLKSVHSARERMTTKSTHANKFTNLTKWLKDIVTDNDSDPATAFKRLSERKTHFNLRHRH